MNLLTNQRTLCTASSSKKEEGKKENKKRRNNNSEGFCGWQARWMMIRKKSDFSIHKEKRKVSKKNKFIHQETFSFNFKNWHAIEYFVYVLCGALEHLHPHIDLILSFLNIPLLNCQRSIFLTVSIIFPSSFVSYLLFFAFCFPHSYSPHQHHQSRLYRLLLAAADTFWAQNITQNAKCKQQNNSIISWYHTSLKTMCIHHKKTFLMVSLGEMMISWRYFRGSR